MLWILNHIGELWFLGAFLFFIHLQIISEEDIEEDWTLVMLILSCLWPITIWYWIWGRVINKKRKYNERS